MSQRWWEQERIDLETAKGRSAEMKTTDSDSKADSEVDLKEGWISGSSRVSGSSGEEWSGAERSEDPWRTFLRQWPLRSVD